MLFEFIENNDVKEPQQWCEFSPGVKFLVYGLNKPSFRRALDLQNSTTAVERADITLITNESAKKADRDFGLAVGYHLVGGWAGVGTKDTAELERNKKNVEKIFCDSTVASVLVAFVIQQATRIQNESNQQLQVELGKSQPSTSSQADTQASQTTRKRKEKR